LFGHAARASVRVPGDLKDKVSGAFTSAAGAAGNFVRIGGPLDDASHAVSETAAGILDGATGGLASKAFGASCWDSKWHSAGIVGGAWAGSLVPGAAVFKASRVLGGSRATSVLSSGATSGAAENVLNTTASGGTVTVGGTAVSAGIGPVTADIGDGFRGSDANPSPQYPIGIGAGSSAVVNAFDDPGRYDGC
jgi:hypothetical protein